MGKTCGTNLQFETQAVCFIIGPFTSKWINSFETFKIISEPETQTERGKKRKMGFELAAFKTSYEGDAEAGIVEFWKNYDKENWSLWRCTYDYPDDTENLDAAIEIVTSFMKNCSPVSGKCQIFGVMHTTTSFEIEGLFLIEGADPEPLFGVNEDTSWFSWSQIGPDASDAVKAMVSQVWGKATEYNGKEIKNTQTFFETTPSSLKAEAGASAQTPATNPEEELAAKINDLGEQIKAAKAAKKDKAEWDPILQEMLAAKVCIPKLICNNKLILLQSVYMLTFNVNISKCVGGEI